MIFNSASVVVSDQRVGDAAQLHQTIPVCVVSREARNFQSKNDAYVGQRYFAGETGKSGALVGTGTR